MPSHGTKPQEGILYVREKIVVMLRVKAKASAVQHNDLEELVPIGSVDDDELMVPIDVSVVDESFKDIKEMLQRLAVVFARSMAHRIWRRSQRRFCNQPPWATAVAQTLFTESDGWQ